MASQKGGHPAEKDAPSACPTCLHRAVWHHDERGCQYNGNGPFRCSCRRTSDQVVARIVADAVNASHRLGQDDTSPTPPGADRGASDD